MAIGDCRTVRDGTRPGRGGLGPLSLLARVLAAGAAATWLAAAGCGGTVGPAAGSDPSPAPSRETVSSGAQSVIGTTLTRRVPFAQAVPAASAEHAAPAAGPTSSPRAIRLMRTPTLMTPAGLAASPAGPPAAAPLATAPVPEPQPAAATLDVGFAGLGDFDTVIPPDTMGAAGPDHLMSILNSEVGFFSKSGTILARTPLQNFWASLGTGAGAPADDPFDPKVLYDQHSGRFVAVTLGNPMAPDNSWLLVGVSATSDPTGLWNLYAVDADIDNGVKIFSNWADFPGLGVDGSRIYVTANMFDVAGQPQYAKVWAFEKAGLLAGSQTITWTEFLNPPEDGFTLQPAHVFGTASAEYVVNEGWVDPNNLARRFLRLWTITAPGGTPILSDLGFIEVAPYSFTPPGAPQQGSAQVIDTGDTRLLNAVWRNGRLYATHNAGSLDNMRTEAAWYEIDPSAASMLTAGLPVQQGRIADAARSYYYPSIAVNGAGEIGIGFSGSSSGEFAGAYFTGRAPSDPAGTMAAVVLLKAGLAPYEKDFGTGTVRWGDFSATCIDPTDDATFWTLQEYAETPNANPAFDRWGTWWGRFTITTPPPAPSPLGDSGLFGPAGSDSGGGCAVVRGRSGKSGLNAAVTVALLLLPAAVLMLRRRTRGPRR